MKTFVEFMSECYFLLSEAPKPPDYNYEEAFVRLYNYLTGSEDRKNPLGKQMRNLIQRSAGDSAEAADAMNDIVSLIIKEVGNAETDTDHPLHFDNAPDIGFTKGKKTDEHKQAYYEKLNGQKYTFLNLIGSKSGRSMGAKGLIAVRAGNEKIPLTTIGAEVYGKSSDTSKADVLFKDRTTGEILHTSSLKDVGGSVGASSGPEETKGNLLMGMYASLDSRLEKKEINQNEYDELVERGKQLASEIALKMTTKGLSKEEEKNIINPKIDSRKLFKTMGDFENSFPGVSEYVAKEQITGKGKYGQGVDSVLKTNKGGELIEFPEFLSAFVNQRFRTSKHGEMGNVSVAADNLRVPKDVDIPEADPESMYKITASRLEMKRKKEGDKIIADLQSEPNVDTPKSKTFDQFQQDTQSTVAQSETSVAQAQQALADAETERAQAQKELETNPDGTRTYLQHQGQKRANNPKLNARIVSADQKIQTTTTTLADVQAKAAQAKERLAAQSKPQQPEAQQQPQTPPPEPQQSQQPQPSQPTEPQQSQQPQTPPPEPQQPEAQQPQPQPPPQNKKGEKGIETPKMQRQRELRARMASAYDKKVDDAINS